MILLFLFSWLIPAAANAAWDIEDYKLGTCAVCPSSRVDLSTTMPKSAVDPQYIDLSTVTTALGGKLSSSAGVSPGLIDLSTVTTALAGKLGTGGVAASVASGGVNFSTVTIALQNSTVTVSASLLGNGASSSPLGVDSSSVAVKQSGLIVNSEIDSSSITKLGQTIPAGKISAGTMLGGIKIPVGDIDLSTVAASGGSATVAFAASTITLSGAARLLSYSILQLQNTTPVLGDMFWCNNCTLKKVVVATGTSKGNFSDAIGGVFK